jgi:hypothetical protein
LVLPVRSLRRTRCGNLGPSVYLPFGDLPIPPQQEESGYGENLCFSLFVHCAEGGAETEVSLVTSPGICCPLRDSERTSDVKPMFVTISQQRNLNVWARGSRKMDA